MAEIFDNRYAIRIDNLSNFNISETIPGKHQLCAAKKPNGNFELKLGDGINVYSSLPVFRDDTEITQEQLQNEINRAMQAEQGLQIALDTAINNEALARQGQVNYLNLQIQDTNNVLAGVHTTTLVGILLTRVIGGATQVQRHLFDPSTVFVAGKTLVNDIAGTVGVYIQDIDSATIEIQTITVSPTNHAGVLLGEVDDYASLPLTTTDVYALWGVTAELGDWVRISADENSGGIITERNISLIDGSGNITWGNAIPINTSDYQQQSTTADSGKVLVGGTVAGTFGDSIPIDTTATAGSNNLITSDAVASYMNMLSAGMLPIGTIISAAWALSISSMRLLDGSIIYQDGAYSQFAELVKSKISSGQARGVSEYEWQEENSTIGQCGAFVVDDVNRIIRLPRITRFIGASIDLVSIGKTFQDTAPNITGSLGHPRIGRNSGEPPSGAFTGYLDRSNHLQSGSWGDGIFDVGFNASLSCATYGRNGSTEISPVHTKYPYYIVVANTGQQTQVAIDINNVMGDLASIEARKMDNDTPLARDIFDPNEWETPPVNIYPIETNAPWNLNQDWTAFDYIAFQQVTGAPAYQWINTKYLQLLRKQGATQAIVHTWGNSHITINPATTTNFRFENNGSNANPRFIWGIKLKNKTAGDVGRLDYLGAFDSFATMNMQANAPTKLGQWCIVLADETKDGKQTKYYSNRTNDTLSWVFGGMVGIDVTELTQMIPDYANAEQVNRITANNGTWTVDRDGFVRIGFTPTAGNIHLLFIINSITIWAGYIATVQTIDNIYYVKAGDTVQISSQNAGQLYNNNPFLATQQSWSGCYFIPPKFINTVKTLYVPPPGASICTDSFYAPDGSYWWRKYSDGWIEQGGQVTRTNAWLNYNLTLPVAMADTNYTITSSIRHLNSSIDSTGSCLVFYNKTTTGVSAFTFFGFDWEVKGRMA